MVKPQHKLCPPYQGANDSDEEVKKSGDSDEAMEEDEKSHDSDEGNQESALIPLSEEEDGQNSHYSEDTSLTPLSDEDESDWEDIDQEDTDSGFSFTSDDGRIALRGRGREVILIPDFVIAKTDKSGTKDKTIVIVNIKLPGHENEYPVQLLDYLFAYAKTHPVRENILGLWISGMKVQMVEVLATAGPIRLSFITQKSVLVTDEMVLRQLRARARRYWKL